MQHLHLQGRTLRVFAWTSAFVLALSYILVGLMYKPVSVYAADVTSRSIAMASSEENVETDYTVEFTVPAGTTIGAVRIEFCDNSPIPHTTCTFTAVGDDIPQVDANAGAIVTEAGGGGAFAFSGASTCTDPSLTAPSVGDRYLEVVCNTAEAFAGATTFTGTFLDVDNPSNATDSPANPNNSFYARIYIYSTTSPVGVADPMPTTGVVHTGGIAMSTAEQLTVTARVQEILEFCVGTNATAPADCSGMTGNSVDLGVLDFASINRATTQSSPSQGSIMVRTNAANGVDVNYFAEQATTGSNHLGALRVAGATCDAGVVVTDQCINSVGTTQDVIVAGTEEFGMCVFGVDTSSGTTTNFAAGINGDYDGDCDNTAGNGYAFDESGAADDLADTSTVVNDEMLEIDFAATSSVTTPTGLYSVTLTFIGTSTF